MLKCAKDHCLLICTHKITTRERWGNTLDICCGTVYNWNLFFIFRAVLAVSWWSELLGNVQLVRRGKKSTHPSHAPTHHLNIPWGAEDWGETDKVTLCYQSLLCVNTKQLSAILTKTSDVQYDSHTNHCFHCAHTRDAPLIPSHSIHSRDRTQRRNDI